MRLDILRDGPAASADVSTPSPLETGTVTTPTRRNLISFPSSANKAVHSVATTFDEQSRSRCVSVGQGSPLRTGSPSQTNNTSHATSDVYDATASETNGRRSSNTSLFDAVRKQSHQNRPSLEISTDKHQANGHSAVLSSPISPTAGRSRTHTHSQSQGNGSPIYNYQPTDDQSAQYYSTHPSGLSATSYPFFPAQGGMVDTRYQFSAASPPPFGYAYTYPHEAIYPPWWSSDGRLSYLAGTGTIYPGSPPPGEFYHPQSPTGLTHQSSPGYTTRVNVHAPAFYPAGIQPERTYPMQSFDGTMSSNQSYAEPRQYHEFTPGSHAHGHFSPASPEALTSAAPTSSDSSSRSPQIGRPHAPVYASIAGPQPSSASERNQLNIPRIEDGLDTRTTVMVKNIPNKMSDRDLISFIHKVCPRRIDFLYLRMDFQNGTNFRSSLMFGRSLLITDQDVMLDTRSLTSSVLTTS